MTSERTVYHTSGPDETLALGQRIAKTLLVGDCLALDGDLGAGKTQFVRGIAGGLGGEESLVSSPTYVLVQHYPGPIDLFHIDLYRMGDPEMEFLDLGIEEMLETGVVAIEWADRAGPSLPRPRRDVRIDILSPTQRRITITGVLPEKWH